jgi:hypothetical protein
MSSLTAQATQRSSVTRATAAKPIPVVRHTTSRIVGTAAMLSTATTSLKKPCWSVGAGLRSVIESAAWTMVRTGPFVGCAARTGGQRMITLDQKAQTGPHHLARIRVVT